MTKTESLTDKLKRLTVDQVTVLVDELECLVSVVKPEYAPKVQNFAGFVNVNARHYFISSDVPEKFRLPVIAHEVRCIDEYETAGHCCSAVNYEMKFVAKKDMKEYLAMRLKFANDMMDYHQSGDPDFFREIKRARDALCGLYAEYV